MKEPNCFRYAVFYAYPNGTGRTFVTCSEINTSDAVVELDATAKEASGSSEAYVTGWQLLNSHRVEQA